MDDDGREPIIVLSTGAYKAALDEILLVFTRDSGFAARAVYDSAASVAARIEAGEVFDVAISTTGIIAALTAKNLVSGQSFPAGRNDVCLAFRAELAPPEISTPQKLREFLLAAPSISMSDPKHGGGSSKYFIDTLEALGLAATISPKLVLTAGGQGALPVAEGRAAFGIAQTSEVAMLPGLAATPLLPGTPGSSVTYELALSARLAHPGLAAFAAFFAGPAGLAIRRKSGLG